MSSPLKNRLRRTFIQLDHSLVGFPSCLVSLDFSQVLGTFSILLMVPCKYIHTHIYKTNKGKLTSRKK